MGDADYNKNLTAAEYDAILILQAQNPRFRKIEGKELKIFYDSFETFYNMSKNTIKPFGQNAPSIANFLLDSISYARQFIQNYANTRTKPLEKSIHFLGGFFGRLLGGIQFGFKATNHDVGKFKDKFLDFAKEIVRIVKTINSNLKLKYLSERILKIYHENPIDVHFFTVQFAQELSR